MNPNLLREDERTWCVPHEVLADTYNDSKIITELLSRLCEARAEKYEFAAQQLEALLDCADGVFIRDAIMLRIAALKSERKRLTNA